MKEGQLPDNLDNSVPEVSRRNFLRITGSGIFICLIPGAFDAVVAQPRSSGYPDDLNAYLKIGDDGRVAVFCSKIEMGQGIITSMAQMMAEELDVSLNSIDMIMGDTMLCPWDSGTTGSRSTKYYGPPLRRAGAEARAVLLQMASEHLDAAAERLVVKDGIVSDRQNPSKKVSYASLIKGKQIVRNISDVSIKPVSEHKVSGKAIHRMDARIKVTGEAKYTSDIVLPGMLYAKVLRPPSHDARMVSVDVSPARTVSGIVVVHEKDLVAVLHENPEQAERALALVSVKWDVPEPVVDNRSLFTYLKEAGAGDQVYVQGGKLAEGHKASVQTIKTEFYNHYVAHAPMEPYSVLAHVEDSQTVVWASTQAPFQVRRTAADTLGIPEEQVHVITPFVGGGFGGKKSGHQISEAVRLSKITGHPVQLAWTREEEFFYDNFRPAAVVQLESGLDAEGRITFWECNILFAGTRSSEPIYNIPHFLVRNHSASRVHPFGTGAWRGPGSNTNVFAMESHADILAHAAGMDSLSFRMKNLTDERMVRVLSAAAEQFGHPFEKGPTGRGYGISCTNYLNTYVATIAQISVTEGNVKVQRVVCAQDMGEIINPQGAKLQIESGILMGLGAALSEEVQFSGGTIHTRNFSSYPITRFSDVPEMEVVLVDNPGLPPQGCGEPAITTIGAALANAIYDAVGARLVTLPMTPERILTAMKEGRK